MKIAFLISWIFGSLLMFFLSYMWHGIFLNDFSRIALPESTFMVMAGVTYSFIGLIISIVGVYIADKNKLPNRMFVAGVLFGFVLMCVTQVLGVSLNPNTTMIHLAIDFGWQCIEQGIGAWFIGFIIDFITYKQRTKTTLINVD